MVTEYITFQKNIDSLYQGPDFSQSYPYPDVVYDRNTYTDWGLIPLHNLTVAPPPLKSNYINHGGQMGEIDTTDISGIFYGNRRGKWQFKLLPRDNCNEALQEIVNYLHGIVFTVKINTQTNYYKGRITVDDVKSTESGEYITLGYVLDPFRYAPSSKKKTTFNAYNHHSDFVITRMPAIPKVTVNSRSTTTKPLLVRNTITQVDGSTIVRERTFSQIGELDMTGFEIYANGTGVPHDYEYNNGGTTRITWTIPDYESGDKYNLTVEYIGGWL